MKYTEFKQLRMDAGIERQEMADALHISSNRLSKIENGTAPVRKMHELAARYVVLTWGDDR